MQDSILNKKNIACEKKLFPKEPLRIILLHNSEQCQRCKSNQERFERNKLELNSKTEGSNDVKQEELQNGVFNLVGLVVVPSKTTSVCDKKTQKKGRCYKPTKSYSKKANCRKYRNLLKKSRSLKNSNKCNRHTLKHKRQSKISTSVKDSSIKNATPGKGTMKRKRWLMKKLANSEDYEDDIYEGQELYHFENTCQDADAKICNMATPKYAICLSPRDSCDTPLYEDCISPEELSVTRREAEEYQYRRSKRRKTLMSSQCEVMKMPDAVKEKFDVSKTLEEVSKAIAVHIKQSKEEDSEEEEEENPD